MAQFCLHETFTASSTYMEMHLLKETKPINIQSQPTIYKGVICDCEYV